MLAQPHGGQGSPAQPSNFMRVIRCIKDAGGRGLFDIDDGATTGASTRLMQRVQVCECRPGRQMSNMVIGLFIGGSWSRGVDWVNQVTGSPGGGGTPRVLGRQLPPPPPLPRGLRPTVSCQRCRPQESMGAEGARCSMGTKAAQRKILFTLHPSTIPEPNPDPST